MKLNRKNTRRRENLKQHTRAAGSANIHSAIAAMRDGLACYQNGDFAGALKNYTKALSYYPKFAEAYQAQGVAWRCLGQWDQALDAFRMAIELKPDAADNYFYCGDMQAAQGNYTAAAKLFQHTIVLAPQHIEAHAQLGRALYELFLFDQALQVFEAGIALSPAHGGLYHNLALTQIALKRAADAAATLERAVALRPDAGDTLAYLVSNKMFLCDWKDIEARSQQVADLVLQKKCIIDPFTFQGLNSAPSSAEQFINATAFTASNANKGHTPKLFTHEKRSRTPAQRPIRVGYVSMDFRAHPMAYLLTDVLEKHDRDRFEIYAYSFGPPDNSPERQRFIKAADHFIDIQNMNDQEAAQRIYQDEIDILIDRKGHTFGNRLGIFAFRPAPIQVNYLAFCGTMGAGYIDYVIVDDFVVPPDQQEYFTERLVYLPDTYLPNSARPLSDAAPARTVCGLPENAFVFFCFNQTYKITPEIFSVWMRILHRTPGSVLWLLKPDDTTANNLSREAALRGVDFNRLVFAPKMPQAAHMARHHHADLFLDTPIVNAITTTCDALLMGCPVLTCPGETFVGRVAGSLLRAFEMPELIASNLQEYEDLAVAIATTPQRYRSLREKVAHKRETAPLFNSTRYTRHLDAAYLEMWRLHQVGEAPKPFAIAPIS